MKFVALFLIWMGDFGPLTALPWVSYGAYALDIVDYSMLTYTHDAVIEALASFLFGLLLFIAARGLFRGLTLLHRFGVKLVR
jgi:hypothetical protein